METGIPYFVRDGVVATTVRIRERRNRPAGDLLDSRFAVTKLALPILRIEGIEQWMRHRVSTDFEQVGPAHGLDLSHCHRPVRRYGLDVAMPQRPNLRQHIFLYGHRRRL